MNASFLRREWGAVTFVLTVAVGMVIVPLALYFGNQAPAPVALPVSSPSPAASGPATPARTATPARSANPSPSPSR